MNTNKKITKKTSDNKLADLNLKTPKTNSKPTSNTNKKNINKKTTKLKVDLISDALIKCDSKIIKASLGKKLDKLISRTEIENNLHTFSKVTCNSINLFIELNKIIKTEIIYWSVNVEDMLSTWMEIQSITDTFFTTLLSEIEEGKVYDTKFFSIERKIEFFEFLKKNRISTNQTLRDIFIKATFGRKVLILNHLNNRLVKSIIDTNKNKAIDKKSGEVQPILDNLNLIRLFRNEATHHVVFYSSKVFEGIYRQAIEEKYIDEIPNIKSREIVDIFLSAYSNILYVIGYQNVKNTMKKNLKRILDNKELQFKGLKRIML